VKGSTLAKTKLQNPNASAARTSNPPKAKLPAPSSQLQIASTARTPKLPASSSELQIASILAILYKWGIHTLGQLAALDKEELRDRLGADAVRLWERANGTATRLLKFVQPPETFDESFEFDHEIETAEPLLFMLRRFLEQLALRLSSIYLVARELTLTISFSDKKSYERVFKIPQPTVDVDLLFRMLQTHLENFKSEHPIVAVALTAQPIRPASQQFGLFETALRNPQQLYETLARLSALLGNDRVGTPVLEETHRPDAFRMEPFSWNLGGTTFRSSSYSSDVQKHVPPILKPALRRFRPAAAASIFTSKDRHFQSGNVAGKVVEQSGPFLFSGNWWDEKAWARAEYDMQLEDGDLVRAHESEGTWKVDGIYD
jgi:protein ImuB